jgi:hypothetical protein
LPEEAYRVQRFILDNIDVSASRLDLACAVSSNRWLRNLVKYRIPPGRNAAILRAAREVDPRIGRRLVVQFSRLALAYLRGNLEGRNWMSWSQNNGQVN